MLPSNNPAVGLATRQWLTGQKKEELIHSEGLDYIIQFVDHCRAVHPGGMVHDLAVSLGADRSTAMTAGSIAEMFYSVSSLTDDIQDNDTNGYWDNISTAMAINIQSQFLCLIAVRINGLAAEIGIKETHYLVTELYRTGAMMLTGQQYEIARSPWNGQIYDTVARLSAGEQFAFYLKLAAAVAKRKDLEDFAELGRIYGTLLQYVTDKEFKDARLDAVSQFMQYSIYSKLSSEMLSLAERLLEPSARPPFEGLTERCRSIIDSNRS